MREQVIEFLKNKGVQKEFKKNGDLESLSSTLDVNKLIDKELSSRSKRLLKTLSNSYSDNLIAIEIRYLSTEIKELKLSILHADFHVMSKSDMEKEILTLKGIKKVLVKTLVKRNL